MAAFAGAFDHSGNEREHRAGAKSAGAQIGVARGNEFEQLVSDECRCVEPGGGDRVEQLRSALSHHKYEKRRPAARFQRGVASDEALLPVGAAGLAVVAECCIKVRVKPLRCALRARSGGKESSERNILSIAFTSRPPRAAFSTVRSGR
jgi:hypothetical protein